MKTFLTALALCSIASAWPFAPVVQNPPPNGTQFYQLQAKSSVAAVNNQWLGLKTGQTSYSLASTQAAASKFFTRQYQPAGTYNFYSGDDNIQLVLQGPNGTLLYLADATNPGSDSIPGGQLMEWGTFTMDQNQLGVKDGNNLTGRTFVAVKGSDGSYGVALYDGSSNTTQSITPITLSISKAT